MRHLAFVASSLICLLSSVPSYGQDQIEISAPDTVPLYSTARISIRMTVASYDSYLDAEIANGTVISAQRPMRQAPPRGTNSRYTVHFIYHICPEKPGVITINGPSMISGKDTIRTAPVQIYVRNDARLEDNRKAAEASILEKTGLSGCHLVLEAENGSWCIWRDYHQGVFAIVAKKGGLLLGYGHDKGEIRIRKIESVPFLRFYSEAATQQAADAAIWQEGTCYPLLSTSWGQGYPYNQECPLDRITGKRSLLGCGAIAMAQLLSYYEMPGWEQMDEHNSQVLYKKLYKLSRSLGSRFSSEGTSTNLARLVPEMGDMLNPGYGIAIERKPSCAHAMETIASDLRKGKPLIGVSDSHAYIIDGMQDSYIHIVMGWGGLYDGYYLMVPGKDGLCMADCLLHGIGRGKLVKKGYQ